MVEKKAKLMSAREERAHNKKNVTKVDPDDDDTNVHRLVQDENAKTILLNFPLEVSFNEKDVSTATSTASKCKPSPRLENHPGDRKQSTSRGSSVDPEKVKRTKLNGSTSRIRSASVGRDKKSDMQARYWAFLFENLRRAVDDLYRTCESDENIPASKEVILVFENYVRDFKNLADWLRLKWEYENTPPFQRPTSLAWEVRKTPPASNFHGKLTPTSAIATQRLLMATPAKRVLDFDQVEDKPEAIKEVEVTPVEDSVQVKKDAVVVVAPTASVATAAGAVVVVPESGGTGTETKLNKMKGQGYSAVTKASMQKQTGPKSAPLTSKTSSSGIGSTSKRPSTAPISNGRINSKSSTSSVGSKQDQKSSRSSVSNVIAGSSNKENKEQVMTKSSSSESSTSTMIAKVKKERVSLVQRQTRFAANVQQNNVQHRPLSRSVTTPSLPGRGRTTTSKVTSSTRPKLPDQAGASNKSGSGSASLPFGSTSSISSSSSSRSWADTVKGLKAPRSVEDLKTASIMSTYNGSNKKDISVLANLEQPLEDGGWKTVKSRIRSKYSPAALKNKTNNVLNSSSNHQHSNSISIKAKNSGTKTAEAAASNNLTDSDEDSEIVKKDEAIAKVEQEEKSLQREIRETEKSEMPLDEAYSEHGTPSKMSDSLFDGLSWADQIDLEEQLLESRYPGRAIQLHEKLSSPARKREPQEAFKVHQEKQKNAKMRRLKFQDEKATKLSALNARIEEVIAQKDQLINEQKDLILCKMAKAEAKRQEHIDGIRKKARVEDAKLKEIAFINELNEQNARIDLLTHNQTADEKAEERLAELADERAKKAEQREAKEAAAEERRRAMEAKRMEKVQALREKIQTREERIQEEQEQKEKDRIEAAREKARDREEKLSSVKAAEQDMKEKRQEKLQQKQEYAAKRHMEQLACIRNKAFESTVQRYSTDEAASSSSMPPILQPYLPRKKCEICKIIIHNEVQLQSHLRGKKHKELISQVNEGRKLSGEEIQTCNLKYIVDAADNEQDPKIAQSKERSKAMKKRSKKIKTRMSSRAAEFEASLGQPNAKIIDAPNKAKIGKGIRDVDKLLGSQGKGSWPDSSVSILERALGEISRSLDKNEAKDKYAFYAMKGFQTLARLFGLMADQKQSCVIPLKSVISTSLAWKLACRSHRPNTEYVLKTNYVTLIVDILLDRLNLIIPDEHSKTSTDADDIGDFVDNDNGPVVDPVSKALMNLLSNLLEDLNVHLKDDKKMIEQCQVNDLKVRAQDQVSYIVAIGIVDKLSGYCHSIRDPIDNKPDVAEFLLSSFQFLSSITGLVEVLSSQDQDPTHLWKAYEVTDLAGTVELLYGMLLHQGTPSRSGNVIPPKLPSSTLNVVISSARLLHKIIRQHLLMVQNVLSQEGISLEFRHIISYLLWYCQAYDEVELMHEAIILVGYFAANHSDNQTMVQSGHQPSVLQQLCNLPFPYFSQTNLREILFPTLLACCHENQENLVVLSQEMSWTLIDEYLKTPEGQKNALVQLILMSSTSKK